MNPMVQVQPPVQVDPLHTQRMSALAIGNQRRLARAAIRRHLRTADTRAESWGRLADLLEDGLIEEARDMTLAELLHSCAQTGPRAVTTVLLLAGVSERRLAGKLSGSERANLYPVLRAGQIKLARRAVIGGTR